MFLGWRGGGRHGRSIHGLNCRGRWPDEVVSTRGVSPQGAGRGRVAWVSGQEDHHKGPPREAVGAKGVWELSLIELLFMVTTILL